MATQNYEQTRQLLEANPSLAYALYQAMHQMNLIDLATQQRARSSSAKKGSSSGAPPPPPPQLHPQSYASERDRSLQMPPTLGHGGSPSVGYMMPPPPSAQPQDVAGQERLVRQIMGMSTEQINALPPDQRDQVMRVRAQMMGQHLPH